MRDIKFRGKRIDNGEWVYGYYLKTYSINTHWIIKDRLFCSDIMLGIDPKKTKHLQACYKVHPETVGQYTGLKDKKGVDIYEGGIVASPDHRPANYAIDFIEGGFCATHPEIDGFPIDINHFYPSIGCRIKIIGNIHDDPNLLEIK